MSSFEQNTSTTSSLKKLLNAILNFPPYLYFPVKLSKTQKAASDEPKENA
ncbi:hypothetical protein [Enterovibrio coralii]|nr:hypothetical protein [Enterovibrio coralii]